MLVMRREIGSRPTPWRALRGWPARPIAASSPHKTPAASCLRKSGSTTPSIAPACLLAVLADRVSFHSPEYVASSCSLPALTTLYDTEPPSGEPRRASLHGTWHRRWPETLDNAASRPRQRRRSRQSCHAHDGNAFGGISLWVSALSLASSPHCGIPAAAATTAPRLARPFVVHVCPHTEHTASRLLPLARPLPAS